VTNHNSRRAYFTEPFTIVGDEDKKIICSSTRRKSANPGHTIDQYTNEKRDALLRHNGQAPCLQPEFKTGVTPNYTSNFDARLQHHGNQNKAERHKIISSSNSTGY